MMKTEQEAANVGKKQRGKPFKPGQSGNPLGKKPGTRHKSTLAAMALLSGEAQALTRICIEKAMEGDMTALKLCLDRIIPPTKDHPFDCTLPKVTTVADIPTFTAAILDAVAGGEIGATEGEKLARIVQAHREAIELSDIDNRLKALEAAQATTDNETEEPGGMFRR